MSERSVVYRHRQVGYPTLIVLVAVAIVAEGAAIVIHAPSDALTIVSLTSLVLLFVGVVFSSLTVEIDDRELRAWFGLGLTAKRVVLADVAKAEAMPSSFWNGWGIRVTTRGWLYNVAGNGAVEVTLKSGQRFRIGTDEEDRLTQAIARSAGLNSAAGVR